MNRRDFLTASCLAGSASLSCIATSDGGEGPKPEYYELKQFQLFTGPKKKVVGNFLRKVMIPALNRLGIGPVGVFNAMYGPNQPTLYVLLPHESLQSVATLSSRLLDDAQYRQDGVSFIDAPPSDPNYVRIESSLLAAFSHMPRLQAPIQTARKEPRIFELRIYESHSMKAGKKKIEMFNEGGEIEIFRNTGLNPVFFGETLIGPKMPNLHYMLSFGDMAEREKAWGNFRGDPGWKKLRTNKEYAGTVSNITDIILKPAPFSQI